MITHSAETETSVMERRLTYGRIFVPEALPENVIIVCASCELVDETRRGHTLQDCHLALREEVKKLQSLIPTQGF